MYLGAFRNLRGTINMATGYQFLRGHQLHIRGLLSLYITKCPNTNTLAAVGTATALVPTTKRQHNIA